MRFFLYHNNRRSFSELSNGAVIGRSEGSLVYPDDPFISRQQCRFHIVRSEIYIEDLGSTNQTRVNTVPIRSGARRRIRLHDVIEVGNQRLVLTQQDRHSPPNTEDLIRRGQRFYSALRKDDGSLTATITGLLAEKTRVLVSKAQYTRLQLKKALTSKRRHSVEVRGERTRQIATSKSSGRLGPVALWAFGFCALAVFLFYPASF